MDFASMDECVGRVISETPYVKILNLPKCVDGQWQALAQVNGALCIVALRVSEEKMND